jgi:N,N-dimethylformamidase
MMSTQNQTSLPIVGYTDRLSVAPDENIRFMVSCDASEYQLEIVRLRHGHPNPAGPGFKEQVVPASIAGKYSGKKQDLHPGSYAIVPDSPSLRLTGSFTIQAWIYPTTVNKGLQAIVTKWSPVQDNGYGLFLDENACLAIWLGDEGSRVTKVSSGVPLRDLHWYFVAATFDQGRHEVTLLQRPLIEWPLSLATQARHDSVPLTKLATNSVPLLIAAAWQPNHAGKDRLAAHFNGKIGNPSLFQHSLKPDQLDALMRGQSPRQFGDALLVSWDFSAGIGTDTITDISGHELHGKTVNLPARGVTGHNWNGCESNFAHAPGEYGAIHFHEDDLADAAWDVAADFAIPSTMPSGVYAARLSSSHGEWHVPFFVRPRRGTASSPIAFLAPTFSYLAYANMHSGVPGLLSLYDYQRDGTGVRYASRFRPLLDLNPKYLKFYGEDGRTYGRHFCADLSLLDWMDANDFSYDVITDDDLHREGEALLRPYSVVVTGSHPEYYSKQMLDGLQSYLHNGGRLMYLGGNGFYWVTSVGTYWPHPLEVRRWGGTETWGAAPGEYHHSTTGELGGLWRNRGRAPQSLVGVGFCADGWLDEPAQTCAFARPYMRTPASQDRRAAFIFEGVASDTLIGDFESLSLGHGAAGDEVDRVEPLFGSPPHTLCVAAATGFQRHCHAVEERHYAARFSIEDSTVRSDMVYFEYPRGGAVFSVGSIAWIGSLYFNRYNNDVSRITRNVLTRFMQKNHDAPSGVHLE